MKDEGGRSRMRGSAFRVSELISSFILLPSSFVSRSEELEHLDKGDYTAEEYEGCLVELRRINRFLGDRRALRASLLSTPELKTVEEFSALDVGAGSGELLREVAGWARGAGKRAHLVGVELAARAAQSLAEESEAYAEISSVRADAYHLPFADEKFDYVFCSLFTHHFVDREVVCVLRELNRVARRGVCVIDLHRHPAAYFLYTTAGRLIVRNRLTREDGALSIRRGFRPAELQSLAEQAGLGNPRVRRCFPFRLVMQASKSNDAAN